MQHRHLNHQRYTPAAIDDVIARGRWADWADLRRAIRADVPLLERIERVCRGRRSRSEGLRDGLAAVRETVTEAREPVPELRLF